MEAQVNKIKKPGDKCVHLCSCVCESVAHMQTLERTLTPMEGTKHTLRSGEIENWGDNSGLLGIHDILPE